ncbi:hypothetical protein NIES2130_34160 [Scytonema sp. HK-05]|nr:hypothetical protein NIES2130_34160 [Scytonema sp. HK-05]
MHDCKRVQRLDERSDNHPLLLLSINRFQDGIRYLTGITRLDFLYKKAIALLKSDRFSIIAKFLN